MFIPGIVISILTFPGVIVHELAHQLVCRLLGVAVFEVSYFRFDFAGPAGYVMHETPQTPFQHVLIGIGPFFVNSILGLLIALPAAITTIIFNQSDVFSLFMLWLGLSIAMHAFPSIADASNIWAGVWKQPAPWAIRLFATPIVALIYVGALGSVIWLDLAYGIGLVFGATLLLVNGLA